MDAEEQVRYSAELGRFAPAGPPGHGEVERVRDVLVVAGDPGIEQGDASELILLPRWEGGPFDRNGRKDPEPIELGRGLRLEKLDHEEGERVLNACSPRGHFFVPVRQFGQMYSLVLDVDPGQLEQGRWTWDTERRIREAVAMSRLVLDNGYSFEYAARVFDHAGEEQQIMPAGLGQPSTYRVRRTRDWLRDGEADELRELLVQFWDAHGSLPERVEHALWVAEYVVSVRWLDVIGPLLVVAFEALVNTSRQLVTRQFEERVPAITEEVEAPLSASLCARMYDARSRWVHGRRVSLYAPPKAEGEAWEGPTDAEQEAAVERVAKSQDSLRAVLRRCIEDPEFRAIFTDDEAIKSRWPVTG